jgi:hypothetical protein
VCQNKMQRERERTRHHCKKKQAGHNALCEISGSHGGEYEDQNSSGMIMEAVRNSETSVDNYCTRQYIPEDNSEHHALYFKESCFRTVSSD